MNRVKSFFQRLFPQPVSPAYWVTVKCNRCGEVIRARVNLYNDLSLDFNEKGEAIYFCRKTLMGEQRCFQRVEVTLTFDAKRNLIKKEVTGGQFVEPKSEETKT